MNRTVVALSAILVIVAAGLTGFLVARPGELAARNVALNKELHEAREEILALKAKLAKPAPVPLASGISSSESGATPRAAAAPAVATTASGAPATSAAPDSPAKAMGKMFRDPAMREMMKKQQAMQVEMSYAKLFQRMHLSDNEKARFTQLLSDRLSTVTDLSMKMMDENVTPDIQKQVGTDIKNATDASDTAIRFFLNSDDDFSQFKDWENTQMERTTLDMGRSLFTSSGEPLSDDQEQQLIKIMADARKTNNAAPDMTKPGNFDPGALTEDAVQKQLQQMDAQAQTVNQQAASILSPTQVQTLGKVQ